MPMFLGGLGNGKMSKAPFSKRVFIQEKCSDIDNSLSENKIPVGIFFSGVSCVFSELKKLYSKNDELDGIKTPKNCTLYDYNI